MIGTIFLIIIGFGIWLIIERDRKQAVKNPVDRVLSKKRHTGNKNIVRRYNGQISAVIGSYTELRQGYKLTERVQYSIYE